MNICIIMVTYVINFTRLKMKKTIIIFLLPLLLTVGCILDSGDDTIRAKGTVTFIDFEGGFYGIVSDDGKRYDPVNLADMFQTDSLRVQFEARERKDLNNYHQWGILVEILEMHKL